MEFKGKAVVVTGGAQGTGKCIAECFAREGATVHVIDVQEGPWFVGDLADKATLARQDRHVVQIMRRAGRLPALCRARRQSDGHRQHGTIPRLRQGRLHHGREHLHRRGDALLSIEAKAESVLVTYDLNAEIVRNYAGIDKSEATDVDLTSIVDDYAELFGDEAEAKGVKFVVSRPPDAVIIRAHEDKLRRLVANLMDNAVKYTERGSVSVTLETTKSKFFLTVADTGVGMTEDEKRLIYHSQKGL